MVCWSLLANQVKASRDERTPRLEAEDDEDDEAEDEAYEESDEHEEAGDDASEPVEDSAAEGVEPEVAEEPAHHARPATREATTRKSAGGVNREAARPSRSHIAVESSAEAPEVTTHTEAPAAAPAHSSRAVPARSAATRSTEPSAGHRQERRQQRPSRFQPIRRGSVLFDQESGSAASSAAPRAAAQPQRVAAGSGCSEPACPASARSGTRTGSRQAGSSSACTSHPGTCTAASYSVGSAGGSPGSARWFARPPGTCGTCCSGSRSADSRRDSSAGRPG